jgi:hypothetical protein
LLAMPCHPITMSGQATLCIHLSTPHVTSLLCHVSLLLLWDSQPCPLSIYLSKAGSRWIATITLESYSFAIVSSSMRPSVRKQFLLSLDRSNGTERSIKLVSGPMALLTTKRWQLSSFWVLWWQSSLDRLRRGILAMAHNNKRLSSC